MNLWRNPHTIYEALDLAERIRYVKPSAIDSVGFASITSPSGKLGEVVSMPAAAGAANWTGALFAQTECLRTFLRLEHGHLHMPGSQAVGVPVCKLGALGSLGYDRRDIHDAFTMSTADWSPYPAFWDHKADKVVSVKQEPNAQLIARITPAKGRPLKDAAQVWSGAGRILLVERLWPITHRVLSVGFDQEVLGNTWWALKTGLTLEQEKALLLWLNSTAALLLAYGRRVATHSAWMQMKKPAWASMPVLDVGALSETDRITLAKAYDRLASKKLAPIAQLAADAVRAEIDETLCKVLDLPSLAPIRELLAREPGLTAKDITPRRAQRVAEVKEAA